MNYLQRKKLAFMSIVNQIKGFVRTVVGIPPLVLPDCVGGTNLINYSISGNSVQDGTPTPDAPVEIENVGEKSKNLLKIEGRTEGTLEQGDIPIRQFEFDKYYTGWARNNQYYPWYTISHSIKENLVSIEPYTGWYGIGFPMKAKPNTTYYMSNLNKYQMGVSYYTKDGEYIGASANNLFTTPNNCEIMVISCTPTTTGITTVYEDIQVEEGTVATDYEPYGYKIPITVRGKNLIKVAGRTRGYPSDIAVSNATKRTFDFDTYIVGLNLANWYVKNNIGDNFSVNNDGSVTLTSTNVSYGIGFPIPLKPNTSYYTPRCDSDHNYNNVGIAIYKSDGTYSKQVTYGNHNNFTTASDETIGVVIVKPTTKDVEDTISEIFMEENPTNNADGTLRSDYEPYQEPTETAIYLDEPLRKVGDVADYIDFENRKVVRNIGAKKVDFNIYSFDANTKYLYLRGLISDMLGDSINCISNKIKQFATFPGGVNNNQLMVTGRHFYYFVKSEENQQQYYVDLMAGTEIHYIFEVPVEEAIQLPTIPLFKGITVLSPDTIIKPSIMSATYYSTSKE